MYDHEVRWYVLAPITLILGFAVLSAETLDVWGGLPVRPDWFWCLAVVATMKTSPVSSLFVFAWCGLARDFLLGPKPGAAMLAFVLAGWFIQFWKPVAALRGLAGSVMLAGVGALAVSLLKHTLDYGALTYKLWDWMLVVAFGDALLTAVAVIPAALVLNMPSFRPWRESGGYYFP